MAWYANQPKYAAFASRSCVFDDARKLSHDSGAPKLIKNPKKVFSYLPIEDNVLEANTYEFDSDDKVVATRDKCGAGEMEESLLVNASSIEVSEGGKQIETVHAWWNFGAGRVSYIFMHPRHGFMRMRESNVLVASVRKSSMTTKTSLIAFLVVTSSSSDHSGQSRGFSL